MTFGRGANEYGGLDINPTRPAMEALHAMRREPTVFLIFRWRVDRATGITEVDVLRHNTLPECQLAYKRYLAKWVVDEGEGPAQRWGICSPDVEEIEPVATAEERAPYAAQIRAALGNFGKGAP